VRLEPAAGAASQLDAWLRREVVGTLPQRPGLGSAHLLKAELAADMTNEQRIRGADAGVAWALLVTGYRQDAVAALASAELGADRLQAQGAARSASALYRVDYTLLAGEPAA
jgi:hypothetical protein